MRIVIIGNGIAGNEVAFTLKQKKKNTDVTIISAEKFPEYDPCLLPYYLSNEIERTKIFKKNQKDYINYEINLILNDPLLYIEQNRQKIFTKHGLEFNYDKLVLAYGSKLFIPPIKGIEKKGVFKAKYLEDIDTLAKHQGNKVVVIGSGAVGIEFAIALHLIGYKVIIVELLNQIMPTMFDQTIATILAQNLEYFGIQLLCNEKVLRIVGNKKVTGVVTNKRSIKCDTVVIATGTKVDSILKSDISSEVEHGIKVNTKLETSVKNIYACGDCAQTNNRSSDTNIVYQLKHNAIEQGRIVAKNILGENINYSGSYLFTRIHFKEIYAASFGKTQSDIKDQSNLELISLKKENSFLEIIINKNRIVGAQAIGAYATNLGLLMCSMFRNENLNFLYKNYKKIFDLNSIYPWFYKKLLNLTKKSHS